MTIFKKILTVGVSACSGGLVFYSLSNYNSDKFKANAISANDLNPSVKWDSNWDRRDPTSMVKPSKGKEDDSRYSAELEKAKPSAVRRLFLVRHGQYNLKGKDDSERVLTMLGREQALLTGKRLQELGHDYTHLIVSTMTRARETASLVHESMPKNISPSYCSLLEEGAPVPPEPPNPVYNPKPYMFFEDGARIEAAFRKHIHRAHPTQKEDSYEVIVCHGNVIRYFVCRALQIPAEAWLRLGLNHASITTMSIYPNGGVSITSIGDSGHLPVQLVTAMGVKTMFGDTADFSKLSEEALSVSQVIQKAFVEVNEKGTEAAAATVGVIRLRRSLEMEEEPEEFIAAHPFAFIVSHADSRSVVFAGRFCDPVFIESRTDKSHDEL